MQKRQVPSASKTGAKNGDVLGLMMPWANMAAHCCSSSSF
jgi:hypothetical protein